MPRCPQCGAKNPPENTTCSACGAVLGVEAAPMEVPQPTVAPAPVGQLSQEGAVPSPEGQAQSEVVVLTCVRCRSKIPEGEGFLVPAGGLRGRMLVLCSTCEGELRTRFQAETEGLQVGRGVLFGLAAVILSTALWSLIVYLSKPPTGDMPLMAFIGGWAIAWAVGYGAGRKRGRTLQWIAAGLTVLMILVSEYVVIRPANPAVFFEELGRRLQDIFTLLLFGLGVWQAYIALTPRRLVGRPR